MKPALLEVMRMNRICRMVLATCLGSFILVIFYFQSMLHPGRGRVSVVLLDIFFSLAVSLARSLCLVSASSTLTSSPWATSRLLAVRLCPGHRIRMRRREDVLPLLLPPALGRRMGPGGAVVFFLLLLCVSCLSVCEVAGKGRGCGKLLGVGGRFEENETPFQLWLKSEDERGAESPPPYAGACCPFLVGGAGRGK